MLGRIFLFELLQRFHKLGAQTVAQSFFRSNLLHQGALARLHELKQFFEEALDPRNRDIVRKSLGAGKNGNDLLNDIERLVLILFQNFRQPFSARQLGLSCLVQIRSELGEGRQFAILRQFQTQESRRPVSSP